MPGLKKANAAPKRPPPKAASAPPVAGVPEDPMGGRSTLRYDPAMAAGFENHIHAPSKRLPSPHAFGDEDAPPPPPPPPGPELRESKSRRAGHRAPLRAISPHRDLAAENGQNANGGGGAPPTPPLALHVLKGGPDTAPARERAKVRPEQQPKTSAVSRPKSPRPDVGRQKAAAANSTANGTGSRRAARGLSPRGDAGTRTLSPRGLPPPLTGGGGLSPRPMVYASAAQTTGGGGASVSPQPASRAAKTPGRAGVGTGRGRKKREREPSGSAEHGSGASPGGAGGVMGGGVGPTCPPPDLTYINHSHSTLETGRPARKRKKATTGSPPSQVRMPVRDMPTSGGGVGGNAFKRTATLPPATTARSPRTAPRTPRGESECSPQVVRMSRLSEGMPFGVPSGLLPAAEMPPRDVMIDVVKRRDLLLRICGELEDSLPAHLKTEFTTVDDGKEATAGRKKGGAVSAADPEEDPGDPRSRIKPVTARFIRRILVLFYASRNAAEEQRVKVEADIEANGLTSIGDFPPAITCMHAAYNVVDSLVRIGHRRVLKVMFGNLFWHIIDVLEWPPQVFGGKIRLQHRQTVKTLPAPDTTLVPEAQREEVVKLHRLMYVQNSCLIRACDSVTYFHLNEFIEMQKLRVLHDTLDANRYQPGDAADRCFLASWALQWNGLAPRRDPAAVTQKHKLLASLMAMASCAWEHDKTAQFVQKLYSVGINYSLVDALADTDLASQAAEVLALISSDFGAQEEIRKVFIGVERHKKMDNWKRLIKAAAGEGTHGIREMIHSILTKTSDMWDVMLYLKATEDCLSRGGLLQGGAAAVRNFCDSLNIVILPLRKVLVEVYGGKVVELIVQELALWLADVHGRVDPEVVASVLRTLTLFIRIPVTEACAMMVRARVFSHLARLVPRRDGLLRAAALSLARAVWWRADPSPSGDDVPDDASDSADMGSYLMQGSHDEDPRSSLIPGAVAFLEATQLHALLCRVMYGQKTLCPERHDKVGVRKYFSICTQYE